MERLNDSEFMVVVQNYEMTGDQIKTLQNMRVKAVEEAT